MPAVNWRRIYIHARIRSWWNVGESRALKIGFPTSRKQTNLHACSSVPESSRVLIERHVRLITHTHSQVLLPAYKAAQNVGRGKTHCNLVGVQNGLWLQASGRTVDPFIQRGGDAVHPLGSSGPVQSNESPTEPVDLHLPHCYLLTTWSMAGTKVSKWGLKVSKAPEVIPGFCQPAEQHLTLDYHFTYHSWKRTDYYGHRCTPNG